MKILLNSMNSRRNSVCSKGKLIFNVETIIFSHGQRQPRWSLGIVGTTKTDENRQKQTKKKTTSFSGPWERG